MKTEPLMIRDFPREERPRERFIKNGAESLSNQELLAILLRTGTKEESVLQLANRVLTTFNGLRMLKGASIEEITSIKGIGTAKGIHLLAAIEFGRRISNLVQHDRYTIRSPEDGANYVMDDMRFLAQEHFVVLYLNTKNQVLHRQTIFIGSLNASIVHPREVVRPSGCLKNLPSQSSRDRSLFFTLSLAN